MTSLLSRRSMFAGSASLTFHVALVLLALVLAGLRAVSPPPIAPLAIEVIEPALAPPPSGPAIGTVEGAGHTALAGDPGKRGPTAARRSVSHAPPVRDPYADVVMGYDAPTLDQPGSELDGEGGGLGKRRGLGIADGAGFGRGGDGPGIGVGVPEPPRSLARPPRPKRDYLTWGLPAVSAYIGKTMSVELIIDPSGAVRRVIVLDGIAPAVDAMASQVARSFEFHPALRSNGVPRWGTFRWDFKIIDSHPHHRFSQSVLDWRHELEQDNEPTLKRVESTGDSER